MLSKQISNNEADNAELLNAIKSLLTLDKSLVKKIAAAVDACTVVQNLTRLDPDVIKQGIENLRDCNSTN
ncbi:MAG: hypothetical protein LBN09_02255 [Clostridioides sp.]|jgi:hypothetical protein|nr:hypothetical protein [Clostridioides sp.]